VLLANLTGGTILAFPVAVRMGRAQVFRVILAAARARSQVVYLPLISVLVKVKVSVAKVTPPSCAVVDCAELFL
jgi:hypothetical protein